MAVQINVAANQAALVASIQAGVQAYNQRFARNNQINLSVNARAFSQPLGRITGDVKDFEAALAASNARVIAFGASTAILGGVIRSFKELATITIEVEKNLADINRVFGLTTSQLQKFSTDLFNVSKQTASSFDEASKAALEFSRQGLKAEDTLQRTKDALTLTRLAGISTANAVDALTSTVNGFSATGVTTTQILNKLVAVEQDFAVGAGDLAEALSRTGQAAQEAGVSLDQLNALVTSAQQSTARGGAVIGNALKTIFTRLQRTETLDQLEMFNIAVRDIQGNTLPAVTILKNFAGAYKNLADAQRAQLSEQVAGVYQVNILKAIVNDLNQSQGVYAGALQRGASATNEAEIATAKLNKTLDALLSQTATSAQQLANNIGKVTFEPLARYGTEQLKSLIETMNEILEGEGIGSTFANGLLKGIRNVIAGPGAIAAFFTLFKLIQNSFSFLTQALPQIAGITTETQNRKNIEQSILQIMQQQGPISQALAGTMGNQAAQAQLLLQLARQQTAEYQQQSALAKQLAAQLAGQGVKVAGARGLQVTRSSGYVPTATKLAEVVGAKAGGYTPGRVVPAPVGGVMNTAEDVKYIPGFAQPFINPPANSKAGRAHRQNAISRTGVDPYMAGGFIPNFVDKKQQILFHTELGRSFEKKVGNDIGIPPSRTGAIDFKIVPSIPSDPKKEYNQNFYSSDTFADAYSGTGHDSATNIGKVIRHLNLNYKKIVKNPFSDDYFIDSTGLIVLDPNFTEIVGKGVDEQIATAYSKISSLSPDSKSVFLNGLSTKEQKKVLQKRIFLEFSKDKVNVDSANSQGFIPNFAPPASAIRVPWFKKFANPAYDNIQPTLGISKASDFDTFRQVNFRSNAKGADKVGDSNIFAPLYEDFVFKALQLASQPKIKDQLIRGYVLQPGSDQKQSAFDAFLGDVAFEKKGFPKENLTGSISKNLNDKYERFVKANPSQAAKIKESIIVFNEVGHENQITSQFGKSFSELAGTSYSQMLKNSPDLVKGLSLETNMLLDKYVRNPQFLKMNASKGFIPNFAYKQAVMGLEERMSGNKAIFDTKPFPHIRNSSQPTFSSAIADHGGLSNALSDSLMGQKAAGLMSKGFIPNFADSSINIRSLLPNAPKSWSASIDRAQNALMQLADELLKNKTKVSQYSSELTKLAANNKILNNILPQVEKQLIKEVSERKKQALNRKVASMGSTLAFAGPMAAGLIEQTIFGNRDRTEMSKTERAAQSFVSTGLTSIATGASLGGAVLGPLGAVLGGLGGLSVAVISAIGSMRLTSDELQNLADQTKSTTQSILSSGENYINAIKTIETSTDPEIIRKASYSLAESFKAITDINLQKQFKEVGNDVTKLSRILSEYEMSKKTISKLQEERSLIERLKPTFFEGISQSKEEANEKKRAAILGTANPQEIDAALVSRFSGFFEQISRLNETQISDLQKVLIANRGDENIFYKTLIKFANQENQAVFTPDIANQLAESLAQMQTTGSFLAPSAGITSRIPADLGFYSRMFARQTATPNQLTPEQIQASAMETSQYKDLIRQSILEKDFQMQATELMQQRKDIYADHLQFIEKNLSSQRGFLSSELNAAKVNIANRTAISREKLQTGITQNYLELFKNAPDVNRQYLKEQFIEQDLNSQMAFIEELPDNLLDFTEQLQEYAGKTIDVKDIQALYEATQKFKLEEKNILDMNQKSLQFEQEKYLLAVQRLQKEQSFLFNLKSGYIGLVDDGKQLTAQLGRNLPRMFGDGLVDGIKAAIKESDNLADSLMSIAARFLDEISTTLMRSGIYQILGGIGFGGMLTPNAQMSFGAKQKGGLIRAQNGMYISGSGSGDKYPALLENGEYVLNRRAVAAIGGPSALDTLNFSMAPRFASGGSFKNELNTIEDMEANMTQIGLENSPLYKELSDVAKQNAEEDRRRRLAAKQQRAAMIGSLAAAAATITIGAGISNIASNAQAKKAEALSGKLTSGAELTQSESMSIRGFMDKGLISPTGQYIGGTRQTGFRSLLSGPVSGKTWYQKAGTMLGRPFRRQEGGIIGSRLSDTIPGYMEGGLYNAPLIKKYSAGLQSGGSLMAGGNTLSTVNNNTSATNSFNFNTTVQRDGTINMGSNSTSYEQQDVELSKNLNNKIYAAVGEVIRKEKQFGGSLAGLRNT